MADAHKYDWLVFTSPNAVDAFFAAFYEIFDDARALGLTRIAVVGPGTARKVREYHLAADLMPGEGDYVAEGLGRAFDREGISLEHVQVLWARGEQTREALAEYFSEKQAILDHAIAYRTVPETGDPTGGQERFHAEGADNDHLHERPHRRVFPRPRPLYPRRDEGSPAWVRSPPSRFAENGYEVDVEPENSTIPDFVAAIVEHFA